MHEQDHRISNNPPACSLCGFQMFRLQQRETRIPDGVVWKVEFVVLVTWFCPNKSCRHVTQTWESP